MSDPASTQRARAGVRRNRWWGLGEVAKAVGVSRSAVAAAVKRGHLVAFRHGHWWRVTNEALEDWLRRRKRP